MRFTSILGALGIAISAPGMAATLDLNLSDESAQVKYGMHVGGTTLGRSELTFGFLYNDNDNKNKTMGEVGLLVIDAAGSKSPGLEIGVGPKLYYADGINGNALAIGLGGKLRYKLPTLTRMLLSAEGYYAPGIVSFADADNMYEIDLRIGYEIIPTADLYAGYRLIKADFDKGKEAIDETAMFGMKFRF